MLNPPTESGWYVVEEDGWIREIIKWDHWQSGCYRTGDMGIVEIDWDRVTRWSGPLDLEALLQQGGKE